jgi:hypothetical protein
MSILGLICSEAISNPMAMGKSYLPPLLGKFAGARLTVIRPLGNLNGLLIASEQIKPIIDINSFEFYGELGIYSGFSAKYSSSWKLHAER